MLQVHEKNIVVPHSGTATLFVFGDVQSDSNGFNKEMWQEFVHDFKTTKNAYGIGLGDYGDFCRPSMRFAIAGALSSDQSTREELDKIVAEHMSKMYDQLSFMKGKMIGLHSGHHEWDFLDGTNTTQQLCRELGTTYLYWTAYTVLKVHAGKEKPTGTAAIKIWSTHGSGGGGFSSTDLANLEKKIAPYWVADVYLRGHSSKLEMIPMELNDVTLRGPVPRMIKKTRWLVNCGGFMNGYVDGMPSYVERIGLPPACLGWAKVDIKYTNNFRDVNNKKLTGITIQPTLCSPRNIDME